MIVENVPLLTAVVLITWFTVFQGCHSATTVIGPTDTVYVKQLESGSFNCSVTWDASPIVWGRSRDYGVNWGDIAQCSDNGQCLFIGDLDTIYSIESSGQANDFFKLTVDSATLNEDAHYDCWPYTDGRPTAPHARLIVLDQVENVAINESEDPKTVKAGTPEIFTCTATSGNPPADLLWTIGDKDITHFSENTTTETGEDTRLYDTESRLRYEFNASDDQQHLKCQSFQHERLTLRSSQILMNVEHAPVIQAIVVDSWEGSTVVVECVATANPDDVTYSWESDDGQTGNTGTSNKWELQDEDEDDEVTVTCNASNVEGDESLTEIVKKPYVPTVISTSDNPYTANEAPVYGTSGCDTACIVGISVGCSVVVLLIVILVLWWWLRRRNDDKEDDYTKTASSNHRPTTRDAPADVEMTTASGMTTAAPPSDDVDSSKYSDRGYDDRYEDRYANNPHHRYDEPPDEYNRYNEPPIDEGDGYPNYSNPSSPNYSSYDRRQQSPQLHYADLDLNPQGQNYQPPPREHTEYTTITPTIV